MKPVVLFDVGGVLADLGSPTRLMGLPFSDDVFWQAWLKSQNVRAYETGHIPGAEALPAIATDLGISDLGDFEPIFRRWRLSLFPYIEPLIERLSDDVELALLSNINPIHWQQLSASTQIFDKFSSLFLSFERGIFKPDAKAFEVVIESLGRDPAEILFLDDTEVNVTAARKQGIDAHRVNGLKSIDTALRLKNV